MTYGPDAQPAIRGQDDAKTLAIMKLCGAVSAYSREIRLCCTVLRERPNDAGYRTYLPQLWEARRLAQKQIRRLEGGE